METSLEKKAEFHLKKRLFRIFSTAVQYEKTTRLIREVADHFCRSALLAKGLHGFRINYQFHIGFYRLGWFLTQQINKNLRCGLENLKPLPAILEESCEFSYVAEDDEISRDSATKALRNSIRRVIEKRMEKTFRRLKSCAIESHISEGPTATSSPHVKEILSRSGKLCKRVNSILEKMDIRHQSIMESSESKLNLHIPEKELSPVSISEFDTDRTSRLLTSRNLKIKRELESVSETELMWKIWKNWKN